MTTAQAAVDQARVTLLDAAKRTWSDAELLGYLNSGIEQACGTLLDVYVIAADVPLSTGVRQALPAGGLVMLDVVHNTNGGAVTQAALSELSRTQPTWAADASSADTKYFMLDPRAPATFYVYPPASSGCSAEILYGAVPDALVLANTIPISPAFNTALWAYILGMAYAKNSKKQDLVKSQGYMGLYTQVLDKWKATKTASIAPPDPTGVH